LSGKFGGPIIVSGLKGDEGFLLRARVGDFGVAQVKARHLLQFRLGEFACGFLGSFTNCSSMTSADSSLAKGFCFPAIGSGAGAAVATLVAGNNGAGLPPVTCVVVAFTSACGVSGVLVCGSREFFFPHPTTNKPITIETSTFIAERILPHHPDSEKFRELVGDTTV